MAHEDIAMRRHVVDEFVQQRFLGRPVEVDDDVPAENHVEPFPQPETVVHEIKALKSNLRPQFGHDPHQAAAPVLAPQQVFPLEIHGHGNHALFIVNGGPRLFENPCRYIGRHDIVGEPGNCFGVLLKHHRQGVGLLAGGTPRTPDVEPSSPAPFCPLRQDMVHKVVEMVRLTEKIGLVGGNQIDHLNQFQLQPFTAEQEVAVLTERFHAQSPQPFLQPCFEHGLLCRRHLDAALFVNEVAQPGKIVPAEHDAAAFLAGGPFKHR